MILKSHKTSLTSYFQKAMAAFVLCCIFPINTFSFTFLYKSGYYQQSKEIDEPFFHPVYVGNGVNHMNINLVDLKLSGLKTGDEIGVFDGDFCVGADVIQEIDMQMNLFSVPASANDTLESNQNGYIAGHKISLKSYREGKLYPLYFELVDNSNDVFVIGGTMFAFVNFYQSTTNEQIAISAENIRVYPNPFNSSLKIELVHPVDEEIDCKIFDSNGKLVKLFSDNYLAKYQSIIWDGRNENGVRILSGNYYLKVNNFTLKIILLE